MNVDQELGRVVALDLLDQREYPFENKVEGQLSMLLPSISRPSYQLKRNQSDLSIHQFNYLVLQTPFLSIILSKTKTKQTYYYLFVVFNERFSTVKSSSSSSDDSDGGISRFGV